MLFLSREYLSTPEISVSFKILRDFPLIPLTAFSDQSADQSRHTWPEHKTLATHVSVPAKNRNSSSPALDPYPSLWDLSLALLARKFLIHGNPVGQIYRSRQSGYLSCTSTRAMSYNGGVIVPFIRLYYRCTAVFNTKSHRRFIKPELRTMISQLHVARLAKNQWRC
jgi:hypothetical protein